MTPEQVMGQILAELGSGLGTLLTALGLRCGLWQALGRHTPPRSPNAPGWPSRTCASGCELRPRAGYLSITTRTTSSACRTA
jgi:hypothetical protein